MRRAIAVISVLCTALPSLAGDIGLGARTCQFRTLCTGENDCEPAGQEAAVVFRRTGAGAEVEIDGETQVLQRVAGAESDPETFFGAEADQGGGMMLSIFSDGVAVMTIYGNLFGPFVATAFGTCGEGAK